MGAMAYPAPPAPPTADVDDSPLRPSTAWYWVGVLLMVGGIVGGIVFGVTRVSDAFGKVDDFPRVAVPGRADIDLDAGGYTIFHEYPGASDAYGFSFTPTVAITGPDGSLVDLDSYAGSESYNLSGHEGRAVWTFDAPVDGSYRVEVRGEPEPFEEIAIGTSYVGQMLLGIFGGIALAGLGVLIGGVLMIVIGVKRGRARRARQPPPAFPPPGAYPGAVPAMAGAPTWAAPPPPGAWPPPQAPPPPSWGAPTPPGGGVVTGSAPATWPAASTAAGWAPPPPPGPDPEASTSSAAPPDAPIGAASGVLPPDDPAEPGWAAPSPPGSDPPGP
jgi:hypothetical protein